MNRIYTRKIPGSKNAILLLPCLMGSLKYYEDFIYEIPSDWSIHSLIYEGHCRTPADFVKSSLSQWRQQCYELYDAISSDYDNIYIIGFSLGTLFAMELGYDHSDKIRKLFLIAPPTRPKLTPRMIKTAYHLLFTNNFEHDEIVKAAYKYYSVGFQKSKIKYFSFLKQYKDVLNEIHHVNTRILHQISIPITAVCSSLDEIVHNNSKNDFVDVITLPKSYHFYYHKNDYETLIKSFHNFCLT